MATYYVDSNATGLNDGSSWTDAWTSLGSSLSVAGGDKVLVANNHSETLAGNTVYSWTNATLSNPIQVISTNPSNGSYTPATTIQIDGAASYYDLTISANVIFHGIYLKANDLLLSCTSGNPLAFIDCKFDWALSGEFSIGSTTEAGFVKFTGCQFDYSGSAGNMVAYLARAADAVFDSCSWTKGVPNYIFSYAGFGRAYSTNLSFMNCDLSDFDTVFSGSANLSSSVVKLIKCKLKTGQTVFPATIAYNNYGYIFESSDSASLSSRCEGLHSVESSAGQVTYSSTEYRANGANDGDAQYSWKMASSSTSSYIDSLSAVEIAKNVEIGSQTITVYIAGGASLNDDDFWVEVESPSEEVSPTAQGKFRTTKPDPLATPTALTSDTSSWTGTGVGTKQKVEVAISPTIAGTVTVRCYLAKPSTTVYVDPKISTTGNQRVFNGVLVDGEAAPSGGGGAAVHPLYAN